MLPSVVQLFRGLLAYALVIASVLFSVEVQAQLSTNRDDYDFGWIAMGVYDTAAIPTVGYCINAEYKKGMSTLLNTNVTLVQCFGLFDNELWAYQNSTKSIIMLDVNGLDFLCFDGSLMALVCCNSSAVSQQWTQEGNRLKNGVNDSLGNPQYLWGQLYSLLLNSYNRSSSHSCFFTFLSIANWAQKSTPVGVSFEIFTTEGLLDIASSPLNQIANGDFEITSLQAGNEIAYSSLTSDGVPMYLPLGGWVIRTAPIDYVKSGLLMAQSGSASLHLNTHTQLDNNNNCGSISQTFRTEEGKALALSFWYNAFPVGLSIPSRPNWSCGSFYFYAQLEVRVTDACADGSLLVAQIFTMNASTVQQFDTLWKEANVSFTPATNVTTITFRSLNTNSPCGPMVDSVTIGPVLTPHIPPVIPILGEEHIRSSLRRRIVFEIAGSISVVAFFFAILVMSCALRYRRAKVDCSRLYKGDHARVYSIKELRVATKDFTSVLGEGGFGKVYKAEFPDGTMGGVKVEKPKGPDTSSKFLASDEFAVLWRVHHRNLVNLIGYCIDKGRHILVFEYLPNGSLFDRLHCFSSGLLSWKQRVKIAVELACGLEYLHHEADPPLVHRDIKSQNILLTATDSAKLADFGLSKSAPTNDAYFKSINTAVKGTIGYLDPQYLSTGVYSPKSDVYSFGVVVLELITGQEAISLPSWTPRYMTSPSLYHELVDKKLNGVFDITELEALVDLSRMCREEDCRIRPSMRQVVAFLNSKKLSSVDDEVSELVDESTPKESFHKMEPMSIDFESMPRGCWSEDNVLAIMSAAQPKDSDANHRINSSKAGLDSC